MSPRPDMDMALYMDSALKTSVLAIFRGSEGPDLSVPDIARRFQAEHKLIIGLIRLEKILEELVAGRVLVKTGSKPALYTLVE